MFQRIEAFVAGARTADVAINDLTGNAEIDRKW